MPFIQNSSNFSESDFTNYINNRLSYLNSIKNQLNNLIIDIEDSFNSVINNSKKTSLNDSISNLGYDMDYAKTENLNKNIRDIKLKIVNSTSINTTGKPINSYYSQELFDLKNVKNKNNKIDTLMNYMSLNNKTQQSMGKSIGLLNLYETDFIKGRFIEDIFEEINSLIDVQTNSNVYTSNDFLNQVDSWNEELSYLQEDFLLNDNGKFVKEDRLSMYLDNEIKNVSNGEQLNNIVPDNYSDVMSGVLNSINTSSTDSVLNNLMGELPSDFLDWDPKKLTTEYGGTMSQITDRLDFLGSSGNLPDNILNQYTELPSNITDILNVSNGSLPFDIQDGLGSLMGELGNLSPGDLSSLLNQINISSALGNLPDLDSLTDMINMGDLSSLGNFSGDFSSIFEGLSSLDIGSLPGNLSDIMSSLPDNFGNIMNGLGGIPDLGSLGGIADGLTSQLGGITSAITGGLGNLSSLATGALSSLGGLIGGMFGSGGSKGSPGPTIPRELW